MAQNISDQYEMVNSIMRMVGEAEFEFENHSNDVRELQSLIDRYVDRLRKKNPGLIPLPIEIIPDIVLAELLKVHSKLSNEIIPDQEQ